MSSSVRKRSDGNPYHPMEGAALAAAPFEVPKKPDQEDTAMSTTLSSAPSHSVLKLAFFSALLAAACFVGACSALAQTFQKPWGFTAQNRASIAALMRQTENQSATAVVATPSTSVTNLVCGGGDASSALGNSTCVILSEATGDIRVGQDTAGDQSASTSAQNQLSGSGVDDVLAALAGKE